MRVSRHFVLGLFAPFGNVFVPPEVPKEPRESLKLTQTGFERDAENIRGYWTNVGNYINNSVNSDEQGTTSQKRQ